MSAIDNIKQFVEASCQRIGSGSFMVPQSLYGEFLSLLNNINIVDKS